jgi:hypothetical protein
MGAMAKILGTKYSDAFKAVRHKVEMFVSPNAHGMYYRPAVGPGVGGDNCARSCAVVCRGEWGSLRERALHPNAARGYGSRLGMHVIKCRFCSAIVSEFGRTSCVETHLLKISFYDHIVGDFFACSGSLKRHCKQASHSLAQSLVCNRVHGDRGNGALGTIWFIFIVN